VLEPCVAKNPAPFTVSVVEVGDQLTTRGACVTTKLMPLLSTPFTVTAMSPVVAPVGKGAWMDVALQLEGVAAIPLNLTVLDPRVAPKFTPEIPTDRPTGPEVGDTEMIVGTALTVNAAPLLATPFTVTTTLPAVAPQGTGAQMLVALQLVGVAAVPLNVTVLDPCVGPKFAPVMFTTWPATPDVGDRLVTVGLCAAAGEVKQTATNEIRSSLASRAAPRATNRALCPDGMLEPLMVCSFPTTRIVGYTVSLLRPKKHGIQYELSALHFWNWLSTVVVLPSPSQVDCYAIGVHRDRLGENCFFESATQSSGRGHNRARRQRN
jgi:hypothetical protein